MLIFPFCYLTAVLFLLCLYSPAHRDRVLVIDYPQVDQLLSPIIEHFHMLCERSIKIYLQSQTFCVLIYDDFNYQLTEIIGR